MIFISIGFIYEMYLCMAIFPWKGTKICLSHYISISTIWMNLPFFDVVVVVVAWRRKIPIWFMDLDLFSEIYCFSNFFISLPSHRTRKAIILTHTCNSTIFYIHDVKSIKILFSSFLIELNWISILIKNYNCKFISI